MIRRTRAALLSTAALLTVVLVPVRAGDHSVKGLAGLVKQAGTRLERAATAVGGAVYGALVPFPKPQVEADGAVARQPQLPAGAAAAAESKLRALGYDPAVVLPASAAYRAGDLAGGDAIAARSGDVVTRLALEWLALRLAPAKVTMARLDGFLSAHPDWPSRNWFRHQDEARLYYSTDGKAAARFFAASPPTTVLGKLALAKALKDEHPAEAVDLARSIFRDSDLGGAIEARFRADFGTTLTRADYKYRADKLLYREQIAAAMRYAALAGGDVVSLERARVAVILDVAADKAIAAVPDALRHDPGLILAEVQQLRRDDKLMEAAQLMQSAPKDAASLIDADDWWTERRVLARRLLDNGNINAAYVVCATHSAATTDTKIEAEFHAGWIALRFMNDPVRATYHFGRAAKLADTPLTASRIGYWQGRTAEAAGDAAGADAYYRKAAGYGSTFYGQLARQLLGITATPVRSPAVEATAGDRDEAVRVVELLYAAGARDTASALAIDAAQTITEGSQARALATVVRAEGDAHVALTVGKLLGQHGLAVDTLAFPTFGIPPYEALQNSAAPAVVYAIARQESAFMPAVVSKAGAKGLMQIIDATARHVAAKAGLPFEPARLTSDPAFNAQLGAAHLGELIAEQDGSLILTFAAYNAGAGRVKQWIDAYGDPRSPGVDPIDWIERIPFTETRNYVQRVMANVTMYEAIFADEAKASLASMVPPKRDHRAGL